MISVSQSELRTFRDCKRRWYLTYYLGLKRSEENPATDANLGTRIHKALEHYYRDNDDPVHAIEMQYDAAEDEYEDNEFFFKDLKKERKLAKVMIEGYLEWVAETGVDEDIEVISAEEDLRVPGPVEGTELRAKMDLRIRRRSDGARLFLDHKTMGSFQNAQRVLHIDGQMRFYALLEKLDGRDDWTDGGLYNILRRVGRTARAKPPFYVREECRYTIDDLRSEWLRVARQLQELVAVRTALDAGEDHRYVVYPSPTRDCSWKCTFFSMCPLMDDGSRWEDMANGEFIVGDPYSYYDELVLEGLRKLE
jgi:hypothetical protein